MRTVPVTEAEIINIMQIPQTKNSSWYYEISSKIIRYCAPQISKPLSHVCNLSLQSGICPERLMYLVVRPIHKKRDKTEMTNYRPM